MVFCEKKRLNSSRHGLRFAPWILLVFGRCDAKSSDDLPVTGYQQREDLLFTCTAKGFRSVLFVDDSLQGIRGANREQHLYMDEKHDWIGSDQTSSFKSAEYPAGRDGSCPVDGAVSSGSPTSITTTSSGNIFPTLSPAPVPTPTAGPVLTAGSYGTTRVPISRPTLDSLVVKAEPKLTTVVLQPVAHPPSPTAIPSRPVQETAMFGATKLPTRAPVVTPAPLGVTSEPSALIPPTLNPTPKFVTSITRPVTVTSAPVIATPLAPRPRQSLSPASLDARKPQHPTQDIAATAPRVKASPPPRSPRPTTFPPAPIAETGEGRTSTPVPGTTSCPALFGPFAIDTPPTTVGYFTIDTPPPTVEALDPDESVHANNEEWYVGVISVVVDVGGVLAALAVIAGAFKYFRSNLWRCSLYLNRREREPAEPGMVGEGGTNDGDGNIADGGGRVVVTGVDDRRQTNASVDRGENAVAGEIVASSFVRSTQTGNGHTSQGNAGDVFHGTIDDVGGATLHFGSTSGNSADGIVGGADATSTTGGDVGNVYTVLFTVIATLYQLFRLQAGRLLPLEPEAGSSRNTFAARQQPLANSHA